MNLRQAEEYLLDLELFGMRFGLDRMARSPTLGSYRLPSSARASRVRVPHGGGPILQAFVGAILLTVGALLPIMNPFSTAPLFVSLGAAGAGARHSVIDGFWYGLAKRSWQFD